MTAGARIDVVVPVYNEARILAQSIETLVAFLSRTCPGEWCVTIADNGSTDETPAVVRDLCRRDPRLRGLRLEARGRGIALKHAWASTAAEVHAYMDVDLSTDLEALGPLLARIAEGYDIAVGSRHVPHAALTRSLARDILSRGYNALLRRVFHTAITDAQCGFKAVTDRVVRELVPLVRSDGWFFDTELLLLAERSGWRIAQVPVRWVEDHDSRVHVARTVAEYLREVWRLRRAWGGPPPGPRGG